MMLASSQVEMLPWVSLNLRAHDSPRTVKLLALAYWPPCISLRTWLWRKQGLQCWEGGTKCCMLTPAT